MYVVLQGELHVIDVQYLEDKYLFQGIKSGL